MGRATWSMSPAVSISSTDGPPNMSSSELAYSNPIKVHKRNKNLILRFLILILRKN